MLSRHHHPHCIASSFFFLLPIIDHCNGELSATFVVNQSSTTNITKHYKHSVRYARPRMIVTVNLRTIAVYSCSIAF
jgi:hypothetical protein